MDKCCFLQSSISYLGRHIDAEGIHPTKNKVGAIVDAPTLTNFVELSCRYTVRCNRADIAVEVSSYNDIEPRALHGLTHATCHSD